MLQIELLKASEIEKAVSIFHRDGFVAIADALTPEQLATAQAGAARVIREQTEAIALEDANRGFARYSFGDQTHHPEWTMLIDLPTVLPIVDAIWSSTDYVCSGAGGDYSIPGAQIQPLHSDIGDFLNDPIGQTTTRDLPAPFIVVNFLMIEFNDLNGAIRFIPGTQRSRAQIPDLETEPEWMRTSTIHAPAGAAVIRDVRCWHAGTANNSNQPRPMTSVGYYAPWFRPREAAVIPRALYDTLSPRAQQLARFLVDDK